MTGEILSHFMKLPLQLSDKESGLLSKNLQTFKQVFRITALSLLDDFKRTSRIGHSHHSSLIRQATFLWESWIKDDKRSVRAGPPLRPS